MRTAQQPWICLRHLALALYAGLLGLQGLERVVQDKREVQNVSSCRWIGPIDEQRCSRHGRYRDHRQGNFSSAFGVRASTARVKGCWRRRRASSPRATARPFGRRGLTPASASNQGSPCDRRHDVAQQPIAIAGSNGLPVFRTPKHSTNSLRIAATTICLG
jgi:hypothetical protein